eukprot:GCRY01002590.1.p1 GENE.GCRY01002590.1~~GCRY01002590.1.p1  ORF type:complete len:249 (-),score=21.85 GCRY01002590.1:187-888(-)
MYPNPQPNPQPNSNPQFNGAVPMEGLEFFTPSPQQQQFMNQPQPAIANKMAPMNNGQPIDEDEFEPPLLEELGIDFHHVINKTLLVLHPLKVPDRILLDDNDMAGPLCFVILFGFLLMLVGKLHFGYIYGVSILGSLSIYGLLSLMASSPVQVVRVFSILGYSMLPILILAGLAVVFPLSGLLGFIISGACVFWATHSASSMFVSSLQLHSQFFLVAYPVALVYAAFAMMAVF